MKAIEKSRILPFVGAIVLLLHISPALAADGTREAAESENRVEATLTKWVSAYPLMVGTVDGGLAGTFTGEIFVRQQSANGRIVRLQALYEVEAGDRSFAAFMQGGLSNAEGNAVMEGVIIEGWRRGAAVRYDFDVKTNCEGAPAGVCFQGTISIGRGPAY